MTVVLMAKVIIKRRKEVVTEEKDLEDELGNKINNQWSRLRQNIWNIQRRLHHFTYQI
jgi:hypothetical protein